MNIRTLFLVLGLAAAFSQAVPQLDGTYWNSNWDVMYFERSGNQVSSEYIYDNGVITATLSGDTLKGWWREYNNTQACGPGGTWSGAMLFLFDSSGTKFTGSWNYCGDSAALDPKGSKWVGTKRDTTWDLVWDAATQNSGIVMASPEYAKRANMALGGTYFMILTPDVKAVADKLRAAGYPDVAEPRPMGTLVTVLMLNDPDGNRIELMGPLPAK
mgnify:CR=1 FL=1